MNGLDEKEFFDEIILNARSDGKTYLNAPLAINEAFISFQERRRTEERETIHALRGRLEAELNKLWSTK